MKTQARIERNKVDDVQTAQTIRGSEDSYRLHLLTANQLASEAWAAYNLAFHAPESEECRQVGRDLYQRVLEERLQALYERGDRQNSLLDAYFKR